MVVLNLLLIIFDSSSIYFPWFFLVIQKFFNLPTCPVTIVHFMFIRNYNAVTICLEKENMDHYVSLKGLANVDVYSFASKSDALTELKNHKRY